MYFVKKEKIARENLHNVLSKIPVGSNQRPRLAMEPLGVSFCVLESLDRFFLNLRMQKYG